jgi:hypothetical protein
MTTTSGASRSETPRPLSTTEGFLLGGVAACVAVCGLISPFDLSQTIYHLGYIFESCGGGKDKVTITGRTSKGRRSKGLQKCFRCLHKDMEKRRYQRNTARAFTCGTCWPSVPQLLLTSDCSSVCLPGACQDSLPFRYANTLVAPSEWVSTGYDEHLCCIHSPYLAPCQDSTNRYARPQISLSD